MIEHPGSDLRELDRADEPRGGAGAWALLRVAVASLVVIVVRVH